MNIENPAENLQKPVDSSAADQLEPKRAELKLVVNNSPLNAGATPPEELAEIKSLLETAELEKQTPPTPGTLHRGGLGNKGNPVEIRKSLDKAMGDTGTPSTEIEKLKSNKEKLLHILVDQRIRAEQANLSEEAKRLFQENIRNTQKKLIEITMNIPDYHPLEDQQRIKELTAEYRNSVQTAPEVPLNIAQTEQGSTENLALEPRIPEYVAPQEALPTTISETDSQLVAPATTEQGPVTIEGSFTRVPEGQEVEPVLTPEQIKQAKLEKIRAKLDIMTGAVKVRAENIEREKPGALDAVRKVGEMWNKVPNRYKYAMAAGMILSGAGAWTAGYVVASRALGGAGMFVAFDTALKSRYEKKAGGPRPETTETHHAILAGIGAVALAALFPKLINDYLGSEVAQMGAQEVATQAPAPKIEYIVGQGGTLWGGIESKLDAQGLFANMQEGQKTHVIDALKDKFAAMSPDELKAIGFTSGNIDVIHPGDHIDLTKVLGDTQLLPEVIHNAEGLSPEQIASIEHPVAAHPTPEVAPTPPGDHAAFSGLTEAPSVIPAEIAPTDPAIVASADQHIHEDINNMLGTKGFLGFGAQDGMETIDWKDPQVGFASQSVEKVLDVHPSAFPEDGARHFGIEDYSATKSMQEYLNEVMKATGVNAQPNETVNNYLKRAAVTALSRGTF